MNKSNIEFSNLQANARKLQNYAQLHFVFGMNKGGGSLNVVFGPIEKENHS